MNRRNFIQAASGIFVPSIVGLKSKAQVLTLADPAFGPGGRALTCTQLVAQEVDTDYWDTGTGSIAQFIKFSGGSICQIDLKMKWQSGTSSVKVQLWSNANASGSQYGSDSNTINTDTTSPFYPSAAWGQFTFSANPTPSGDFWICLIPVSGVTQWRMDYNHPLGASYYPYTDATDDATYCAYAFAANRTTTDFCFRIHTLQ